MAITEIINAVANFLWSYPLTILLLGVGIYLTVSLKGIQFRKLGHALGLIFKDHPKDKKHEGDISHFQALMTALAATVGTGNIVGVATAIAIGGPGAMFWMWITGLLGMATKFGESLLGIKYRKKNKHGQIVGGPMYYIEHAMKRKWPAVLFAIFGVLGAIGMGNMIQANSIADSLQGSFGVSTIITGIILAVLTAAIIMKGIKSIGKVTGTIVPVMILLYFSAALFILILNASALPEVFRLIFHYAFNSTAAIGGFVGATLALSIRMGVSRGLFSNESGLGSAPVVAAAAKTKNPMTQALISMTQTFIDTIIVCSLTGLVIIITGVWDGGLNGVALTTAAFSSVFPVSAKYIISIALSLFAFSTIIGWSYYGEKFLEYLFKEKSIIPYRIIYTIMVGVGSVLSLHIVWSLADISAALMALPNLIALLILVPEIKNEIKKYKEE